MMTKPPTAVVSRFMSNPSRTKFSLKTSEQIPNISRLHPTPTLQPPGMVRANEPIWEEKKSPKKPFLPHFHLNLSLQSSCSKKMEKVTPLTHSKRHYTWKNMGKKPIWKRGMDLVGFSEDLGIQTWSPSRILWDSKRT